MYEDIKDVIRTGWIKLGVFVLRVAALFGTHNANVKLAS